MNEYKKLLERGQKKLSKKINKKERFEIPTITSRIEGNKTIIQNLSQIASILSRDPPHILKYLQRELATPGNIDKQRLILGRKISSNLIKEKIEKYAKEFVICPECKKPDTKLIREDRILMLKCAACGAKHPIKSKI